ncbi:MAG TPA: nuclear transport factor 2 family protein [Ginsengibacter sp.]
MKRIIVTLSLFLIGIAAFSQQEENGTIYIKHPYIDVVNNSTKAYLAQDWATLNTIYSDTAKWWASGMEKFIPIADAMKMWHGDFEKFDDIKQTPVGYPDYLHYKKGDAMIVQSWWNWSVKSKKTGKVVIAPMVVFDEFNTDGKIVREYIYGDFSKAE